MRGVVGARGPQPAGSDRWGPRRVAVVLVASAVLVLALLLVRGMTYRAAAAWAVDAPPRLGVVVLALAEVGLVGLAGLYTAALLVARVRRPAPLGPGLAAGLGVLMAYGASELVKVLVSELRPCRNFTLETLATCPGSGDWAWPSNHATLAGALAAAVVVLVPRWGVAAAAAALTVAVSRVLAGVHYPHDVMAGLVLGAGVVVLVVRTLGPACNGYVEHVARRMSR